MAKCHYFLWPSSVTVGPARCRAPEDLGSGCCEGIHCLIGKHFEQDLSLETNRKGESNTIRPVVNHAHVEQWRIYKSNPTVWFINPNRPLLKVPCVTGCFKHWGLKVKEKHQAVTLALPGRSKQSPPENASPHLPGKPYPTRIRCMKSILSHCFKACK